MCNTKGFLLLVILVVAVSSEKPSRTEGDSDLTATKVGRRRATCSFLSFCFFSVVRLCPMLWQVKSNTRVEVSRYKLKKSNWSITENQMCPRFIFELQWNSILDEENVLLWIQWFNLTKNPILLKHKELTALSSVQFSNLINPITLIFRFKCFGHSRHCCEKIQREFLNHWSSVMSFYLHTCIKYFTLYIML